jgi:DNA-binding NarL/FixJ family response regulator
VAACHCRKLSAVIWGIEVDATPAINATQRTQSGPDDLTRREREVLELIAEGFTTKEIAARLRISDRMAGCHRSRIIAKLGVRNSVALVRYAIRNGLIQP